MLYVADPWLIKSSVEEESPCRLENFWAKTVYLTVQVIAISMTQPVLMLNSNFLCWNPIFFVLFAWSFILLVRLKPTRMRRRLIFKFILQLETIILSQDHSNTKKAKKNETQLNNGFLWSIDHNFCRKICSQSQESGVSTTYGSGTDRIFWEVKKFHIITFDLSLGFESHIKTISRSCFNQKHFQNMTDGHRVLPAQLAAGY